MDEPNRTREDVLTLRRATHAAIRAVTEDILALRFNRAIARIYELSNSLSQALQQRDRSAAMKAALSEAAETMVLLMAPMMPHLAEECWQALGHPTMAVDTDWPVAEESFLVRDSVTIAVQVDGKRRDELRLPKGLERQDVEAAVLALDSVRRALGERSVRRVVVVPDRIANVVSG